LFSCCFGASSDSFDTLIPVFTLFQGFIGLF
jgi:hypothetical protein